MRPPKYNALLLCAFCFLLWGEVSALFAQDDIGSDTMVMFVGENLYTVSAASRREETLRSAPASVTVLGRNELKRYRTLAEALKSVPGFFLDHSGIKEKIYLRGVADSFLVLLDGVPMSNDASAEDYPRSLELSLDYVEKVEIVRGPGSSLWGADAFSGVVNIVTRSAKDVAGIKVIGETGSFDSSSGRLLAAHQFQNADLVLFGALSQTEGFEPDNSGRNRPDDRFKEVYGKVTFLDRLTLSGRYSNYRNYYTINSLDDHLGEDHTPFSFVQASYRDQWFENLEVSFQGYANYFQNRDQEEFNFQIPQFNLLIPLETSFRQGDWRYGLDSKFDSRWGEQHLFTVGFSWEYDDVSATKKSLNGFDILLFPRFESQRYACYVQDKYHLSDQWEFTAGLRFDKHNGFQRKISPRLALSWFPKDWLDIKFFYGQAFRTPDLYARVQSENVRPEEIESYEGEVTFRLGNQLVLQANYFYDILDSLLENVAQKQVDPNRREIEQGTEFTLRFTPARSLSFYANYTFLFGERQDDDPRTVVYQWDFPSIPGGTLSLEKIFHTAPDNVLNLGGNFIWNEKYTLNVQANYVGKRKVGSEFYGISQGTLSPYWGTDLNLLAERLWGEHLDLILRVRNLFNSGNQYRGENELFRGEKRSWFLEASWKF